MNILFLTHRLPCPADRGCKLRSAAILHGLALRHKVWCAGFLDAGKSSESQAQEQRSLASLRHLCQGVLAIPFQPIWAGMRALGGVMTGGTATEGYFSSPALSRCVARWAEQIPFDAVFAFSSGMAPLALTVSAKRHILCMDDLDSRKWQELAGHAPWPYRLMYDTECRRLASRELEWIDRFDTTLMINKREVNLVADPRLRSKMRVFPPILPTVPGAAPSCVRSHKHDAARRELLVGFVGAMDYEPNIDAACWLAREIWPQVRKGCPAARLFIVGRSPTQAVRDLAADSSISVTGTVPDVGEYFRQMRVHVAPLRIARGVQMKVLAAMAAGCPSVVTSAVAEGIGGEGGREYLVADCSAMFAQCIINLLEHESRADAIGRAGHAFIKRLQPEQAIAGLESMLSGEQPSEQNEWNIELAPAEPVIRPQEYVTVS